MKTKWYTLAVVLAVFSFSTAVCWADGSDDAVKKAVGTPGHPKERSHADIGDDGYDIIPVAKETKDKSIHVSGEILHMWTHHDPTHIKYDITIGQDGTITGTLTIPKPNNPDNHVIKGDMNGKVTGSVDDVKRDILNGQSKMDHAMILVQKILKLVKTDQK